MRNARKTITLYNYYADYSTGYDTCKRTVISGVSVFIQTQVNVSKDGLASASVCTIRIPASSVQEAYVTPKDFQKAENKSGIFTLAKTDKIVLGIAEEETPTSAHLESTYGNDHVMTITGVTDNLDKREPHWKVVCE